jgi:hypothetical protein
MGAVSDVDSGSCHALAAHHPIGRSSNALLRLSEPSVSLEHAALRWSGTSWLIKDLGSTNGTFVNGSALARGSSRPVHRGSQLRFGHDRRMWVMTDDSEPQVMMVEIGGEAVLHPREGVFAIPSDDSPAALVCRDESGGWVLERDGEVMPWVDERPIEVRGTYWKLLNATLPPPTSLLTTSVPALLLEELTLHFRVSRNAGSADRPGCAGTSLLAVGAGPSAQCRSPARRIAGVRRLGRQRRVATPASHHGRTPQSGCLPGAQAVRRCGRDPVGGDRATPSRVTAASHRCAPNRCGDDRIAT